MPRLPTMRVIGSHDISTSCDGGVGAPSRCILVAIILTPFSLPERNSLGKLDKRHYSFVESMYTDFVYLVWSPSWLIACRQFPTLVPPGWLLVVCALRHLAYIPHDSSV